MNEDEIERALFGILKKFIPETRLNTIWEKGKAIPITGKLWNFDAIDLTYLFLEIEKTFQIYICSDCLNNYRFNNIYGIISIIKISLEC